MAELVNEGFAHLAFREHEGSANPRRKELAKCYMTIYTLYAQVTALEADIKKYKPDFEGCLNCGAKEPCDLDKMETAIDPNWPGSPCMFDPTPRQIFDAFEAQRKRADALEGMFDNDNPEAVNALAANIQRNLSDERIEALLRGLSERYGRMEALERERDDIKRRFNALIDETDEEDKAYQKKISTLSAENERLREALRSIVRAIESPKHRDYKVRDIAEAALRGEKP